MCLFAEGGDCAAEICQVCIWMSTSFGNRLCFSHGHMQIFFFLIEDMLHQPQRKQKRLLFVTVLIYNKCEFKIIVSRKVSTNRGL